MPSTNTFLLQDFLQLAAAQRASEHNVRPDRTRWEEEREKASMIGTVPGTLWVIQCASGFRKKTKQWVAVHCRTGLQQKPVPCCFLFPLPACWQPCGGHGQDVRVLAASWQQDNLNLKSWPHPWALSLFWVPAMPRCNSHYSLVLKLY